MAISEAQKQTKETFGFKWKKRETYESPVVLAKWRHWLFEKYFDNNPDLLDRLLNSGTNRKKILDAGCGSGGSVLLLFGHHLEKHDYLGVDISEAISVAKQRFEEKGIKGCFEQSDLNSIPERYGNFDIIFSEGVLHHTDSVKKAIYMLSKRLKRGGKFLLGLS